MNADIYWWLMTRKQREDEWRENRRNWYKTLWSKT